MKDYIEREAVIKGFTDLLQKSGDIYPTDITTMMQRVPTADVKPVVRGKWLPKNETGDCCYQCSDCGFVRDAYILDIGNFCPNCGSYNGGDGDDQH